MLFEEQIDNINNNIDDSNDIENKQKVAPITSLSTKDKKREMNISLLTTKYNILFITKLHGLESLVKPKT